VNGVDIVLLVLLAIAFAGMLWIVKASILWIFFIVVMMALIYISLRHPHGRKDWAHDLRSSVYFIVTAALLIMMLYVMYLASATFRLPPSNSLFLWGSVIVLLFLILLGLFFPKGYRHTGGVGPMR